MVTVDDSSTTGDRDTSPSENLEEPAPLLPEEHAPKAVAAQPRPRNQEAGYKAFKQSTPQASAGPGQTPDETQVQELDGEEVEAQADMTHDWQEQEEAVMTVSSSLDPTYYANMDKADRCYNPHIL